MNFFYCLTKHTLRVFFYVFYSTSYHGVSKPYKGKAILAANHASFLDPPLVSAAWPEELHFLARSSLFSNSFSNWLLSNLNAHPVSGNVQDIESFRLICSLLSEGKKVVIFPEGERSATGEIQTMKSGIAMLALRMDCPIIPVYIKGTFQAWPRQEKWPKFWNKIDCIFGDPIFPPNSSELNKKQKQELMTSQVESSLKNLRLKLE